MLVMAENKMYISDMVKSEGEPKETAENALEAKAVDLIREAFKHAGEAKSVNNSSGENNWATLAFGMIEMAKGLGVLSNEQGVELSSEYWGNRDKIPQNFPDRF